MMRMDFDLTMESLYAFYALAAPDDAVLDAMYAMLGKLPDEAVRHAVQEFRENHEHIKRGENVALTLKKYAGKWRNPNKPGTRAPANYPANCPDGCRHGLFYVRAPGSASPYNVTPCARCMPEAPGARTRNAIENGNGIILDVQDVILGRFHTQPSEMTADPPL